MRSEDPSSRRVTAPLTERTGVDATAAQTAVAFGIIWSELDAALSPIVGPRGVEALGQRSLKLISTLHPWLAAGQPGEPTRFEPLRLAPLLAQHSNEEAQAAGNAFLQTFHGLLSSLIGLSLTDRLLHAAWGTATLSHLNSPTGQDSTP